MIESHNENEIKRKIDLYVRGQLSAEEVEELWVDLVQDDYHLDYLKTVANLHSIGGEKKKSANVFHLKQYWSYAAAAVVALLLGVLVVMNYPAFQSGSDVEPVDKIELEYYRSEDGVKDSENPEIIRNAITLANTGELSSAISLLEKELSNAENPSWIAELSLNIGSLQYNAGKYSEAVQSFQRVVEHENNIDMLMKERAYWFLGNAYFQLNKLDEAQVAIQKAYDLNGAYRRVARSYLDALSR